MNLADVPEELRDDVKRSALEGLRGMQSVTLDLARAAIQRHTSDPDSARAVSALLDQLEAATAEAALDESDTALQDAVEDWQGAYDQAKALGDLEAWAVEREALESVIERGRDLIVGLAREYGPKLLKLAILAVL